VGSPGGLAVCGRSASPHIDLEDVGIQLEQDVLLRDALARHEQNPTHRATDLRRDLHELACDHHALELHGLRALRLLRTQSKAAEERR